MQTTDRSATAYERLSMITAQAELSAQIAFDFVRLVRALDALKADIERATDTPQMITDTIAEFEEFARTQRTGYRELAAKRQNQAISLNEKIQNGVYNND